MSQLKRILLITVLLAIVIIAGCIDDPVAPGENTINGKIYPSFSIFGGYLISIGEYPIVSSASDGSFEISTSDNPYNLTVTEYDPYFNYSLYVLKFTGLTITKPQIVFNTYPGFLDPPEYPVACSVKIIIPEISKENVYVICKFVSDDEFNRESGNGDFQPKGDTPEDDTIKRIVKIPAGQNSITGKIYFLQYSGEGNVIYSYDKFGSREVTLSPGENPTVVFNENNLSNPVEAIVPLSINYPHEFETHNYVALKINSGKRYHEQLLMYVFPEYQYLPVPLLDGSEFKIMLRTNYSNLIGVSGYESIVVNPGEPLTLNHRETIQLLQPDNFQSVTDTTIFEISDNDEPAVYEFNISGRNNLSYFTTKKSVKFSEFNARMFNIIPGRQYYWSVKKYASYTSVDEFLSQVYLWENRDSYIEASRFRTFVLSK